MRVGEIIPETTNAGANHTPPPTAIPHQSGNRPVTDESRLVTALILLVNARVRKHRIPVSGLTRRTFRRAATHFRDDRLRGHKQAISRGETKPHRAKIHRANLHGFGPTLRLFSKTPYNYREGQTGQRPDVRGQTEFVLPTTLDGSLGNDPDGVVQNLQEAARNLKAARTPVGTEPQLTLPQQRHHRRVLGKDTDFTVEGGCHDAGHCAFEQHLLR
jgi:hypothetical protein